MREIWAEAIKRSAQVLANASTEDIARLNETGLRELDYWMVDAAEVLDGRKNDGVYGA